ncbi:ABC-type multidrug transport system fused ATPase/permease subunit [Mycoplasmoides fastidiosum]|uniref:ABC-type multidrug transport system fused ATPase/permease subunit n=1 Tax=Mycoplasmoides fastidiosum TaxID=92758 RepID=A0ABU0LZC2_9BACT|nr:DUF4231 domain-containing protein [Mycoplasmoides fastidiosum]MDQ0514061.1 ABC-type multidrug transport system fused ATPase/permease subunit [Mycoplasmoides fastidiosum]UUD37528.1 DUF4231 domain-containing protein [Mycoplasmoides fastidiosum]
MLNKFLIKHADETVKEFVNQYWWKFRIKARLYLFAYWTMSGFSLMTSLVLGVLATLFSAKVLTQPNTYALSVLIVGAISSFISAFLSFFLLKKRYIKNYALLQFINLEKIIYENRIGVYETHQNPDLLFVERLYQKMGVVSILQPQQLQELN